MDPLDPSADTEIHVASPSSSLMLGLFQLVFVVAVIGGAVAFSAALKNTTAQNRPALADLRASSEISVRVVQPTTISYTPEVKINGTVQSSAEVSLSPQVSGEIKRVSDAFRAGSELQQGDFLFEIDRADYLLAVERAEAEIAAAKSDLAQLEAEAVLAIEEWTDLFPNRQITPLAAKEPQIEAAQARLSSAKANKRTAELSLQRTRVYAPLDARVLISTLDIGQVVSPGQSVGRLVALNSIELAVPVSAEQLQVLAPVLDRPATFSKRGVTGSSLNATVTRLDASLDARTRLSNLYLSPANADALRIGDFVDVTLYSDPVDGAYIIPATALTGQARVWVIDNGKLTERTIVALGEQTGGREIIAAPFDAADGVVAFAPLEAFAGQDVQIRAAEQLSTIQAGVSNGAR